MSTKGQFHCAICDGTNLVSDAPCKWSVEKQDWIKVGEVNEDTFCEDCEQDVKVNFREVQR
ncbi:hypothetical protein PP740_gp092 [Stenotrophomonas phage Philippe]|uniref:Uncharacterized protein n=1 Tax=Stenotrophomonas phage Philippe TaxID=2859655 RepID=A0AAE7WMN0_9CAUD|nr:hypothetical protein PP740_gp092 [Stenotrophomonas phage Philippe]QYW02250.1 hypothetical protein CPT_Philippe_057 [Stenotrophomonas phage Philippe]